MNNLNFPNACPVCKEPINAEWKMCPSCETPLAGLACPGCGTGIKPNWKLCPECETRLICKTCGHRIATGDSGCPVCVQVKTPSPVIIEPVTGMEFIFVAGGSFIMGDFTGDGLDNELPCHQVTIDGFYMGKTVVTQGQWVKVMGTNPAMFATGDDYPVEQVTFEDITHFIETLSNLNSGRFRFRLPTEAEWEFAARSRGKNDIYAGSGDPDSIAWHNENSGGHTRPVCLKMPNAIGLYDMSGNVWEWCRDIFFEDAYKKHDNQNPVMTGDGDHRVIRGGSWNTDAWSARCTRRFSFPSDGFGKGLGFRLVAVPDADGN